MGELAADMGASAFGFSLWTPGAAVLFCKSGGC